MSNAPITVVYKWTARPGQLDALTAMYADVTAAMQRDEPGALAVQCYASQTDNALYVHDTFADASALAVHLQTTAQAHFPSLLAIATPGPFFFFGDVPEPLRAATEQMQLGAEFSLPTTGFARV